jgi:hypothetical protein
LCREEDLIVSLSISKQDRPRASGRLAFPEKPRSIRKEYGGHESFVNARIHSFRERKLGMLRKVLGG